MGKALSTARWATQNFDAERRAIKYLDKSAKLAKVAPKHPGTPTSFDLSPHDMQQLFNHDQELDKRVDKFDIQTKAIKDSILPESLDYAKESSRPLPQKTYGRDPFPDPLMEFGFIVPDNIPVGKLTMRQAVSLVKSYQIKEKTIEDLAVEYKLDQQKVDAIVRHFMLFTLPSPGLWMPPLLLDQLSEEQKLIDQPIENTQTEDDPIGGRFHRDRRTALHGLE